MGGSDRFHGSNQLPIGAEFKVLRSGRQRVRFEAGGGIEDRLNSPKTAAAIRFWPLQWPVNAWHDAA